MSSLPFLHPCFEILWLPYLPASSLLSPELLAGLFEAITSSGNSEFPLQLPPVCHWFCSAALATVIVFYSFVFSGCLSIRVLAPRRQQFYRLLPCAAGMHTHGNAHLTGQWNEWMLLPHVAVSPHHQPLFTLWIPESRPASMLSLCLVTVGLALTSLEPFPLHPLWSSTLGITESALLKATREFQRSITVWNP